MLGYDGLYKLSDFGVAGDVGDLAEDHEGDSRYLPPELLGTITVQPSADLFSFGLMVFELCNINVALKTIFMELSKAEGVFRLLPGDGPLWHTLRSEGAKMLPKRSVDIVQLVNMCTAAQHTYRPSASHLLNEYFPSDMS